MKRALSDHEIKDINTDITSSMGHAKDSRKKFKI
jgi:hypothetical protein